IYSGVDQYVLSLKINKIQIPQQILLKQLLRQKYNRRATGVSVTVSCRSPAAHCGCSFLFYRSLAKVKKKKKIQISCYVAAFL
ncbi:hypothetical protein DVA76_18245, partial [Acinetobacter baumannii]